MSAPAWHALAVAEAADRCGCEIHSGLSTQQVADREARWGRNELPRVAGPGLIPQDAVHRAGSLEDVFVMLTGEDAE